jgi:hypothetical protein
MAVARVDIRDLPRGTTPPFRLSMTSGGAPMSLVGCTAVMVVRDERWEDSATDATARWKRRARFWQVPSLDALQGIQGAREGDIAWVDDLAIARLFDGYAWGECNTDENRITEGVYTIRPRREETMVPVGRYYYSIDIAFPSGEVVKAVKGKIEVTDNTVNEMW